MEQNNADIKKSDLTRVYTSVRKFLAEKDFDSALQALDEILEKDTGNAEALALAGDIYTAAGDTQLAIGHYGLAIQAAPTNVEYKRQFISIAGKITIAQYNPAIEEVLRLCLEAPEVECSHAQILWYTLVRAHPQFLPLLQAAFENPERPFEGAQKLDFLLNPLFLMGIKRIVVCNEGFEEFMTLLRKFLLKGAKTSHKSLNAVQYQAVIEAVALYCFNTDYIFSRTEEEEKIIESIQRELENSVSARQDIIKTGLYACYEPLYRLRHANGINCLPALKAQIEEYLDFQRRAVKITSLTEVTDAVSLKVREQYEEFPFPRWRELLRTRNADSVTLNKAGLQILIAGCGTGQEPLYIAQSCPLASLLAIDLSRNSLAYASRKAEELGISNIEFCHADILQLGSLSRRFDCISSMGVLHHMKDPIEGWKILTGLLNAGGLMRIGLYSALARRSIITARAEIKKGGYPDTAVGMRQFRKNSKKLLGDTLRDKIFMAKDYYHLNTYRDLLFHVQEHQFTLPQIKNILDDLGLEFIEMMAPEDALQNFCKQFPDDIQAKNIDNWHKIEEERPDTFTAMYKFWCRKKT